MERTVVCCCISCKAGPCSQGPTLPRASCRLAPRAARGSQSPSGPRTAQWLSPLAPGLVLLGGLPPSGPHHSLLLPLPVARDETALQPRHLPQLPLEVVGPPLPAPELPVTRQDLLGLAAAARSSEAPHPTWLAVPTPVGPRGGPGAPCDHVLTQGSPLPRQDNGLGHSGHAWKPPRAGHRFLPCSPGTQLGRHPPQSQGHSRAALHPPSPSPHASSLWGGGSLLSQLCARPLGWALPTAGKGTGEGVRSWPPAAPSHYKPYCAVRHSNVSSQPQPLL